MAGYILLQGMTSGILMYDLKGIRFHTPAEHFINSIQYSIEVQLVHQLNIAYGSGVYNDSNPIQTSELIISFLYDATLNVEDPFIDSLGLQNFSVRYF